MLPLDQDTHLLILIKLIQLKHATLKPNSNSTLGGCPDEKQINPPMTLMVLVGIELWVGCPNGLYRPNPTLENIKCEFL